MSSIDDTLSVLGALAGGAAVLFLSSLTGCVTSSQHKRLDRRVDQIDQQVLCIEGALADTSLSAVDRAEQIDDCRWLYQQEDSR